MTSPEDTSNSNSGDRLKIGFKMLEIYRDNQRRFIKTFTKIVDEQFPGWVGMHKEKNFTMVSFGVGAGSEVGVLLDEFSGVNIVGVDISRESERSAQDVKNTSLKKYERYRYVQADATDPKIYSGQIPDNYEVALIRSPNPSDSEQYKQMISLAWKNLAEGGILYLTINDQRDLSLVSEISTSEGIQFIEKPNPEPLTDTIKVGEVIMPIGFPEAIIMIAQKSAGGIQSDLS